MDRAFFESLAAICREALGLQMIERAAARALDLQLGEVRGLGQQARAVATANGK